MGRRGRCAPRSRAADRRRSGSGQRPGRCPRSRHLTKDAPMTDPSTAALSLSGRVCVVTGAASGIGAATTALARPPRGAPGARGPRPGRSARSPLPDRRRGRSGERGRARRGRARGVRADRRARDGGGLVRRAQRPRRLRRVLARRARDRARRHLSLVPRGDPLHARDRRRRDRHHGLAARPRRGAVERGLHGGQGRGALADARHGARPRRGGHPGQRRRPRRRGHALLRRAFERAPDPGAARARSVARHPLGRLGRAEEVAEAVAFLASDAAA